MPSKLFRNVVLTTRICAIISSIASIVLFILLFLTVFNAGYPTVKPGLSLLPVIALALSLLGNILGLAISRRVKPLWLLLNDIPASLILLTFGIVGFVHDDVKYMNNGDWRAWEEGTWLAYEISAYSLLVVAFGAQLLLAVFDVVDHFTTKREQAYTVEQVGHLPAYDGPVPVVKERDFVLDVASLESYDHSLKEDTKDKSTKV